MLFRVLRTTRDDRFGKDKEKAVTGWIKVIAELYDPQEGVLRGFSGYNSLEAKTNADSFKHWLKRLIDESKELDVDYSALTEESKEFDKLKLQKQKVTASRALVSQEKAARKVAFVHTEASMGLLTATSSSALHAPETIDLADQDNNDEAGKDVSSALHVDENSNSSNNDQGANRLQHAYTGSRAETRAKTRASVGKGTISGPRGPADPINQLNDAAVGFKEILGDVSKNMKDRKQGVDVDQYADLLDDNQRLEFKRVSILGKILSNTNPALIGEETAELYKTKQHEFALSIFANATNGLKDPNPGSQV